VVASSGRRLKRESLGLDGPEVEVPPSERGGRGRPFKFGLQALPAYAPPLSW